MPAPEETDMEPQNVSFIESSGNEDESKAKAAGQNLSDRLSRLNITSGSKTYRVALSDDKDSSPSPTRGGGSAPSARPTISSAFKQSRKGSDGLPAGSGPPSLRSNSGRLDLTEEEVRANQSVPFSLGFKLDKKQKAYVHL